MLTLKRRKSTVFKNTELWKPAEGLRKGWRKHFKSVIPPGVRKDAEGWRKIRAEVLQLEAISGRKWPHVVVSYITRRVA